MPSDSAIMKVMDKVCNQCLFSKARVVDEARKEEILEKCTRTHRAFQCHKASIMGQNVICRAFFDGNHSLVVRLAKRFNWFEFVTLREKVKR